MSRERQIPGLAVKAGAFVLTTAAAVSAACGGTRGHNYEFAATPTKHAKPIATRVSEIGTAISQSPTPEPTATPEPVLTPDELIALVDDAVSGVAETADLDVTNAKAEIRQTKENIELGKTDPGYARGAINGFIITDNLIAKLACLNAASQKLPETWRQIERSGIRYAEENQLGDVKHLFIVPSDCPNPFLTSQK